jgi:hypothetical protein
VIEQTGMVEVVREKQKLASVFEKTKNWQLKPISNLEL